MRVWFTPMAERDLESIGDYIASDNPRRAITFVRELQQQCHRIALNPSGYRMRPELGQGVRSCAHGN
jgi:toxin ParE1/3/4